MPRKKKTMNKKKSTSKKSNSSFWKNRFSTQNLIIFALIFGSISAYGLWRAFAATGPTLIFNGNFNTGDFSQWPQKIQQGADGDCCVVVKKEDHLTAGRYTVEAGDKWSTASGERAESYIAGKNYDATEGKIERIHWENYFPSRYLQDRLPAYGYYIFTQWHHDGLNCSIPIQFRIEPSTTPYRMSLTVNHIKDMSTCTFYPADKYDLGVLPFDAWTAFTFSVTWSSNPAIGSVRLIINGKEVLPTTHVATLYPGYGNYLKQGFYRYPTSFTNRVYLDTTRIYRYN